jgi:hypothetical protein
MKFPEKIPFLAVESPVHGGVTVPVHLDWKIENSSTLLSGKYDYHTAELRLMFKNGKEYRYGGVPMELAFGLMKAPSAGKFLHENLLKNNQYRGTLVVQEDSNQ